MKTIKGLILGSAAGLLAAGGAQAADLPVKAKAVEYVRICSLYGAGFSTFRAPTPASSWVAICASTPRSTAASTTSRPGMATAVWAIVIRTTTRPVRVLALTVDTRTATEYGVVRTFGQADFNFDTLGNNTTNPNCPSH